MSAKVTSRVSKYDRSAAGECSQRLLALLATLLVNRAYAGITGEVPSVSVCLSVSLSVSGCLSIRQVCCGKTTYWIWMLFGVVGWLGPRMRQVDGAVLVVNVGHPIVTNGILCVKGGDAALPKLLWDFLFGNFGDRLEICMGKCSSPCSCSREELQVCESFVFSFPYCGKGMRTVGLAKVWKNHMGQSSTVADFRLRINHTNLPWPLEFFSVSVQSDRISKEVIKWAMCKLGVYEWLLSAVFSTMQEQLLEHATVTVITLR